MSKINDILFKLEGLQYPTSLHLNMRYYHIQISKDTSNLCTIDITWIKYHSKFLTMLVSNSSDILQQKISDLFK